MAKRSQAVKDLGLAVSEVGEGVKAANGGSPLPPLIAPQINDMPLVPANDAPAASAILANGSAEETERGTASEISISVEVETTEQEVQEEPALQSADSVQHQPADGAAAPAADTSAEPDFGDTRVVDIRKGQPDCRGEKVEFVYVRRRNCFAIYRSSGRILVQYADDENEARKQVANIAELLPLRDRLQYLVSDLESPHAYQWQIAESLRLGLDGQREAAKHTMQLAIDNILAMRVSQGRTTYLLYAGLSVILVIALLGAITAAIVLIKGNPGLDLDHLMQATGSGAMGALLSTAIALRARTLATDGSWKSNIVDSAARIMIGVISGAILYLFLASGLGGSLSLPDAPDKAWKLVLLAGFLAGFLERLVPDLLENKLAPAVAK
jgi:hypothetical protein